MYSAIINDNKKLQEVIRAIQQQGVNCQIVFVSDTDNVLKTTVQILIPQSKK